MARWFVGLVVVFGVAVKSEPSDEHYDLHTPEYGGGNVSEGAFAIADPYDAYDLDTPGHGVSEDGVPTVPEVGEVAGMVAAFQAAGLGDYVPTDVSDDEGVEPVGGESASPVPKASPDINDVYDVETAGYGVVNVEDGVPKHSTCFGVLGLGYIGFNPCAVNCSAIKPNPQTPGTQSPRLHQSHCWALFVVPTPIGSIVVPFWDYLNDCRILNMNHTKELP